MALALLAAAVWLPSAWRAEFLNFDDPFFFGAQNHAFRTQGLWVILDPSATIANVFLPVSHASLWLDLQLAGTSPTWPHLHSLLLHVLAAFVLLRLLARLGVGRAAAATAAAVFLLHPALVESALWVASRKDVLSGLFTFLCLGAVVRHVRGEVHAVRGGAWIALLALLALYSKGTAVVLPALAALVAWCVPRPERRRPLAAVALLVAIAGAVAWHHASIAVAEGTMASGAEAPWARAPGAFLHYLTTALWPASLDVLYPEVATLGDFRHAVVPATIVLLVWLGVVAASARRRPLLAAGAAWFVLALAPFNTVFPASSIAAADRYLYLALPGLVLAVAGAVPRTSAWWLVAALVPLAWLSHQRGHDFETSERLWRSSLQRDPDNAVALLNLAHDLGQRAAAQPGELEDLLRRAAEAAAYPQHRCKAETSLAELCEGDGRLEEAVRHALAAADAASAFGDSPAARTERVRAHVRAARLARRDGRPDVAAAQLAAARALDAGHPLVLAFDAALLCSEASDESGRVAADDPRRAEAERLIERGLTLDPTLYELHTAAAEWARATGMVLSAEKHYQRAIALNPARVEAHLGRAVSLNSQGLYEGAERAAREAIARGASDPALHFQLAVALGGQGRLPDAQRYYEAYLQVRPRDRAARIALAAVLAALGMRDLYQLAPDVLAQRAERIAALDPNNPKGWIMAAVAARHARDFTRAERELERARTALPGDAEVTRLLAETLRDRAWQHQLAGERDAAVEAFRRFVRIAPREVPTDAALEVLRQEWVRLRDAGVEALGAGDPARAEPPLRRCLELLPDESGPSFQLGIALMLRGGAALEEALSCFERAAAGQRAAGSDDSLAVLYQMRVLRALGRGEQAQQLGVDYVAAAGPAVAPDVLARIRALTER